jgi:tetratricopeptide (TPR) repeat protein
MEDRTADFFRIEETQPARQLFASLQSHRHALRTLIESTTNESLQKRLIATAGETEALIGWVLFDLQRPRAAEQAWRNAAEMAEEVGDGPLAACVLGYWSYLLSSRGKATEAVQMLKQANNCVRGSAAATQAWIAGRQAEEYSALGDEVNALHSLDRAMTVFDYANPRTERVWTSFFTASRLGSLTVSTYGKLDYRETDEAAKSLLNSLSPTENKVRALVLADLATTAVNRGDIDRTASLVVDSAPLAVRTEASLAVDRLWGVVEAIPDERHGQPARIREWLTDALTSGSSRS